ncbi:MAG: radical SAM protein, partial [Candidatus Kryptonium sp.]
MKMELCDSYGRKINYLRISLTDRCNFNCVYCRNGRAEFLKREDILTLEEIEFLALFFHEKLGVEKIRLTGGEPLMRRGVENLIKNLAEKNLKVKITTNGFFLGKFSKFLSEYKVDVNVSLDTLAPEKFKKINGLDCFHEVVEGIDKAIRDGVKLK